MHFLIIPHHPFILKKIYDILTYFVGDMLHFKISVSLRNGEKAADELLDWTCNDSAGKCLCDSTICFEMAIFTCETCVQEPFWNTTCNILVDDVQNLDLKKCNNLNRYIFWKIFI